MPIAYCIVCVCYLPAYFLGVGCRRSNTFYFSCDQRLGSRLYTCIIHPACYLHDPGCNTGSHKRKGAVHVSHVTTPHSTHCLCYIPLTGAPSFPGGPRPPRLPGSPLSPSSPGGPLSPFAPREPCKAERVNKLFACSGFVATDAAYLAPHFHSTTFI